MTAAISAITGFSPISAISGLTGTSGVGGLSGVGPSSPTTGAKATGGINFADALNKVQGSIDQADVLSQQLATGQLTDIHEYTVAASKAQLGVQLTVAMRNQLLSSFQEVMRMQL